MTLWQVISLGCVAIQTIPLVVIDIREHRLPNVWVFPGYAVLAVCWVGMGFCYPAHLGASVLGMFGYGVFLFVLSLLGGMGLGDVKLAGVLGGITAMFSLATTLESVVWSFTLAALFSLGVFIFQRAKSWNVSGVHKISFRHTRIPFGPFMLIGFWVAMITWPLSLSSSVLL